MVSQLNRSTFARDAGYQQVQYLAGRVTFVGTMTADTARTKIGTLPAGSILTVVSARCIAAATGGTPVWAVGTTSGGSDLVAAGITNTANTSVNVVPSVTVVQPFASDTDVWLGTTGGATAAGDLIVVVSFVKPLS